MHSNLSFPLNRRFSFTIFLFLLVLVRNACATSEDPNAVKGFENHYEIMVGRVYDSEKKELSPLKCVLYRKSNFQKGYVDIYITTLDALGVIGKMNFKLRKKDSEEWFLEEKGKPGPAVIMKSVRNYSGFKYNLALGQDYTVLRDFSVQENQGSLILVKHLFKEAKNNLTTEYSGKIVSKEAFNKELKRLIVESEQILKKK